MKPDDTVASATKAMQINIDNVTKKINKIDNAAGVIPGIRPACPKLFGLILYNFSFNSFGLINLL